MEEVKMEIKDNIMSITGEFDLELDVSTVHWGYPSDDEEIFNKVPFEIKPYGDIRLDDLPALIGWIHKNSARKSAEPTKWPRWKVTFERLD